MTKQFDTTGSWIVGVKRLIDNMERSINPVQSPPSRTPSFTSPVGHAASFNQQALPPAPALLPPPPTSSWNSTPTYNAAPSHQRNFAPQAGVRPPQPQTAHFVPPSLSGPQYSSPPVLPSSSPFTGPPMPAPPPNTGPPPISGPPMPAPPPMSGPPLPKPSQFYAPSPNMNGPASLVGPPPTNGYRPTGSSVPGQQMAKHGTSRPQMNGSYQSRPPVSTQGQFRPAPPPTNSQRPTFRPSAPRPARPMAGNQPRPH